MATLSDDTRWLDATAQADLVRGGEVRPRELVEAAIDRIEQGDDALNAVVVRWFEHALDIADDAPEGAFRGVPFLLKDLWAHYAGQVLTNGNAALRAAQPVSDHDVGLVELVKTSGLVTVGRSSSPEFGTLPVTETTAYGATRNPWDTTRTPGGSSGGAAAAVAAGMVPVAHASDGGGSIRIPASCCGLVGLKPSQGRISLAPHRPETGLGVDFAVTRTVRDTASLLDALAVPGVGDLVIAPPPTRPFADEVGAEPGRLRIGMLDHRPLGGVLDPECVEAVHAAAALLESLGHEVAAGHPAALADPEITRQFMAMWAAGRAGAVDGLEAPLGRPADATEVEPLNWVQSEYARTLSAVDLSRSLQAAMVFRRATHQWWADGNDLLLSPTLARPPVEIGELFRHGDRPMDPIAAAADWVPFTPSFNITGQPAISLPLHWSADGLPVGVQLVAAYGREDLLIQIASQLEAAAPWAERRPG